MQNTCSINPFTASAHGYASSVLFQPSRYCLLRAIIGIFYYYAKMLVSLTVGKVDAGVAVLLTQDKRLVSKVPFTPSRHADHSID